MTLICPKCLTDACITLDLDDGDTLRCNDCEEEYTVEDVSALVESWSKLLPWIKQHPARVPQSQPAAAAHGECDACGSPNNPDGSCSRSQCYNND